MNTNVIAYLAIVANSYTRLYHCVFANGNIIANIGERVNFSTIANYYILANTSKGANKNFIANFCGGVYKYRLLNAG